MFFCHESTVSKIKLLGVSTDGFMFDNTHPPQDSSRTPYE
jgi:hypothetical protein